MPPLDCQSCQAEPDMKNSQQKLNILIVEDEAGLRDVLAKFLSQFGHIIHAVGDGVAMNTVLAEQPVDIIVLDINLPGENGIQIARRLRSCSSCGIVMVTGQGAIDEKLYGYDSGADLYLVKPINFHELHAAILSLARRLSPAQCSIWHFDAPHSVLTTPNGVKILLSAQRSIVISLLFSSPGKIVPRTVLFEALGHLDDEFANRRLETLISRMRSDVRKADPDANLPVRARHGFGYAFLGDIC
jgi:DNA-binding response OmpR family regulator